MQFEFRHTASCRICGRPLRLSADELVEEAAAICWPCDQNAFRLRGLVVDGEKSAGS